MGKGLNRYFTKEDKQLAINYLKTRSVSLGKYKSKPQ
jgi:hypothetical protein